MKATLAILLVASASVGINAYPSFSDFGRDYQRTALGNSIDKASLKLLKEAYNAGENKNVIASPLGVMLLLSMYSSGAGSVSKQEINNYLSSTDKQTVDSYVALSNEFGNMNPDFLTLANRIYVDKEFQLNDGFATVARDYKSDVETIDFKDAAKAAGVINKWSDEKTKGHIKSPLSPDDITPDTALGLFNVIFFQGHWHVPFEANKTKDEDFHLDKSTTVKKPTMHLKQSLYYTESADLGARMVELPYKEKGFRMVVVLPNEIDGLASVIEKATEKGLLEDVFKLEPSGRDVDLHIPKFEMKSKHNLNSLLPKVGVTHIFNEPASGIVKNDNVMVSKAFQEAFIKIDEEGATAGAFTGFIAVLLSSNSKPPPPMDFKVDHPFMFLILHEDKIIFAGTYSQ